MSRAIMINISTWKMINISTWNLNATVEGDNISNLNATVEEDNISNLNATVEGDNISNLNANDKGDRHDERPNELNAAGLDTYSPTASPTTSPKSSSPSITPSSFPSVFPSYIPSEYPSTLPIISPSSSPALPECFVDSSGLYGKETKNSLEVNYFYQVQLVPNTASSELEGGILDSVEEAIAKNILPGLFQDTCGDFRRNRIVRQRFLQQSGISGISAQPLDFVFDEVSCQDSEIDCFVIDGRMTVYGSILESTGTPILMKDLIRNSMQSGELDEGVDERVASVEYLDDITRLRNEESILTQTQSAGGSNDSVRFPLWGTAVIASFGVMFLLGGLALYQRT